MTDFDALIDKVLSAILDSKGTPSLENAMSYHAARSALREAIDAVVRENEELNGRIAAYKVDYSIAVNDIAALEAQLNEADKDCENAWKICKSSPHWNNWITPQWDEHVARLSKRGQG